MKAKMRKGACLETIGLVLEVLCESLKEYESDRFTLFSFASEDFEFYLNHTVHIIYIFLHIVCIFYTLFTYHP